MVLCCSLKLATGYISFGASWEGLRCMPRSAASYALPEAIWYELQLVSICSGFGIAWERVGSELRPAAKLRTA